MIDTLKIYTSISEELYYSIEKATDITARFNMSNNQFYYKITNGNYEGSYSSSLSYRLYDSRYGLRYVLELEGSYHKLTKGYNSHNGYYNIQEVVQGLINLFASSTNKILPSSEFWFVQRIDLAFVYDLETQENVINYINNNRFLVYPRRRTQFFLNECVYFAGSRSTLKIYNKLLEFDRHDYKKLLKYSDFPIEEYREEIKGFVRFECEIRKKKLYELFLGKNGVLDLDINVLSEFVMEEYYKLFKVNDKNICLVRSQNEVKNLLYAKYRESKARRLFGFFLTCINDGLEEVKSQCSSSTYYRNIDELKLSGIDFNQQGFIVEKRDITERYVPFTPFTQSKFREVS